MGKAADIDPKERAISISFALQKCCALSLLRKVDEKRRGQRPKEKRGMFVGRRRDSRSSLLSLLSLSASSKALMTLALSLLFVSHLFHLRSPASRCLSLSLS